jgi:hypothetical protein
MAKKRRRKVAAPPAQSYPQLAPQAMYPMMPQMMPQMFPPMQPLVAMSDDSSSEDSATYKLKKKQKTRDLKFPSVRQCERVIAQVHYSHPA